MEKLNLLKRQQRLQGGLKPLKLDSNQQFGTLPSIPERGDASHALIDHDMISTKNNSNS